MPLNRQTLHTGVAKPHQHSPHAIIAASKSHEGVHVLVPELPLGLSEAACNGLQEELLNSVIAEWNVHDVVAWYYTPMAWNFSRHLNASVVVYDCMDELSAFRGAPPGLRQAESELFKAAGLVFTGGASLYQKKLTSQFFCFRRGRDSTGIGFNFQSAHLAC